MAQMTCPNVSFGPVLLSLLTLTYFMPRYNSQK